jgi:DNA-directed RNA polymerase omega subunit
MAIRKQEPFLGLDGPDILNEAGSNKYQAVLAAAKTARRLNNTKVAEYETEVDADRTLEAHKVTSMALEMLLTGEIEFRHPESAE